MRFSDERLQVCKEGAPPVNGPIEIASWNCWRIATERDVGCSLPTAT
jgi:hypothetical protein